MTRVCYTVVCPIFACAMDERCQYGFARNADGCELCECHDPCQVTIIINKLD